ncbi:CDP-glycerol glycerophosphotransferase family protein [Gammaproteobacteria bacterium]|nr:CDP-glycerol glycerophosphotransferase family protein [Gammaproteobacteria bacterium]
MKTKILILFLLIFYPSLAFAYIDPGSSSMLLSVLIGIIATIIFGIKGIYYKKKNFVLSLFGLKIEKSNDKLVFYSEGGQYWHTFKPILEALDKKGIEAIYLTSGECDEGLNYKSNFITTRFIGSGNRAYSYLNTLEAKVCVMSTPGLDVLQILRSKGVQHYAYIPHSPIDMGKYKLYSFDCFDSVFLSGAHQEKSIRTLEVLRASEAKQLINAGCPYMDELGARLEVIERKMINSKKQTRTILIAPTWGKNNLLNVFGAKEIRKLLEGGYEVIIRPHPQSYLEEPKLINRIKDELNSFNNITWDNAPDNFNSLLLSDILISDLSGIVFDYAFIFEKPVITIAFEYDFIGQEAHDLPFEVWELGILDKIGKRLNADQFIYVADIVEGLLKDRHLKQGLSELRELREANLYNYMFSGEIIATNLVRIMREL